MANTKFTVKVPATCANLGPGFDVIGVALKIYNEFEISFPAKKELTIEITGEGVSQIPKDESNLFYQALKTGFQKANSSPPPLKIKQKNAIPLNRGLGSSSSAILGGLLAAGKILGDKLSKDDLISLAVKMEGHPDNLLAASLGGIVLNYPEGETYRGIKFLPPKAKPLIPILVIPEIQISTKIAREILPEKYPVKEVVFNLRNCSLLVYALLTGDYRLLAHAMEDHLHQPYRAELLPGFFKAVAAAKKSGAWGAALSGSGSTLIAFCSAQPEKIVRAMLSIFESRNIPCRYLITEISEVGAGIS